MSDDYNIFIIPAGLPLRRILSMTVNDSYTILRLKNIISEKTGAPLNFIRITSRNGSILKNDETFSDLGISRDTTLNAIFAPPIFPKGETIRINGFTINDFITKVLEDYGEGDKSVTVIGGCAHANRTNQIENLVVDGDYANSHDLFKQQLPLEIIMNNYNENKDTFIFLIDPDFKQYIPEIIYLLNDICETKEEFNLGDDLVSRIEDDIKLYTASALNIFRKINFKHLESMEGISSAEHRGEEILVKVYIIPYIYSEADKYSLKDILNSKGYEYFIYLKNIPHQELTAENFISNSTYMEKLIKWHNKVSRGGYKKSRRKLRKNYTTIFSRKGKNKNIRRLSRNYKKRRYKPRSKLKSFKKKNYKSKSKIKRYN
jgi:hypothetical protein